MGKKAAKATRKFAASGQLQKTIQARKKHQEVRRKVQGKKSRQDTKGKQSARGEVDEEDSDEEENVSPKKAGSKVKSVDDFLSGAFMDEKEEDEDEGDALLDLEDEDDEDEEDIEDDQSDFASVDELEDEGNAHLMELSKLAEKDPEFYKYLQENDRELLDFDASALPEPDDEDMIDPEAETGERAPPLTMAILRQWQKALLEQRSLRALRKLVVAFRAAAHMNEDNQKVAWSIDSSAVYNKLVTTALRYTPVVVEHHVPYKTLPDGRFKSPAQTPKQRTLSKLVLNFFYNVIHVIDQMQDSEMLQLAISESARLLPYVITSRKVIKQYLKILLKLWSSAEDTVRISAIVALRRLCMSTDGSLLDIVSKALYLSLVRASKNTTPHTLPSITLMKNSASEIYCLDSATAYQHAFGYIRQLAIHLRNSMKVKTKEAYKQVYNWQYVHSVDFWSLVLARACDVRTQATSGKTNNELQPLIYPLVQVTLGAIKLVSAARSYPFHFHLLRSLIHLASHTRLYIPLAPFLLPILTHTLAGAGKAKASTLKPLDLDTAVRAPQQYLKTRVYGEALADEAAFLLAEWLASAPVQGSIAFPELVVPVTVVLRKALKAAKAAPARGRGAGKEVAAIRALVERVEESAKWVEERRRNVSFAPSQIEEVAAWERGLKVEDAPLVKYVKVQRKAREKRRQLLEKARKGENETLVE